MPGSEELDSGPPPCLTYKSVPVARRVDNTKLSTPTFKVILENAKTPWSQVNVISNVKIIPVVPIGCQDGLWDCKQLQT